MLTHCLVASHAMQRIPMVILLLFVMGLSGCAVQPVQSERQILAPVAGPALDKAMRLDAQGQSDAAAREYLQLAARTVSPAREQLQLKAARAYLAAGNAARAQQTLTAISRQALTPGQQQILTLTEGELALLDGRSRDAQRLLEQTRTKALPTDLQKDRLGSLATAQRMLNEPVKAAETLNELDPLLSSREERLVNQVSLVSTLTLANHDRLQTLSRRGSGALSGWADIALLVTQMGSDPENLQNRYRSWHSAHRNHPALPDLMTAYLVPLTGGYAKGDELAVLLPRSGRFAGAAQAIRDGINAARKADTTGHLPTIRYLDSGQSSRARSLLHQAERSGAHYAIGPLQKPAVDALASGGPLGIPTLALNETTLSSNLAGNLFQFSLSPENEATEVANKASVLGLKHAVVLYPEGAWGERLATAFRTQWQHRGGTLAGQTIYDPGAPEQVPNLKAMVTKPKVDMVFLVATPNLARALYPQIRQAAGADLVVVSTSHVYSGGFDAARDHDLVGLYFVDIPWMLGVGGSGTLSRHRLMGGISNVPDPLARLYAMGIDAYRLAPRIADLAKNPGAFYPGQTGGLSIDASGHIERQLTLARFTPTGPRPVEADRLPGKR